MNYCTNCGTRHEGNADFCTNCGERVVAEKHSQTPETQSVYSSAAPPPEETQPPVAPPVCSSAPQPEEPQPPVAPPVCSAAPQPEEPQPPVAPPVCSAAPQQPQQPKQPKNRKQPMNRKKSDLPGFMIPAAVAVFLVSAFALLLLFNFILSDYANGGEIKPPVIESSPPVTETTDTPEPTETPVPIETPQPTPTETPVGPDATQALFTGKASDYAAMPKTYGEARNLLCYTILDARDVTYENFLKLEIDMSLSDVMDILSDAEADSYYRSSTDSTRWDFSSNPTKISVETIDDKVIETIFYDPFRVCVDPADISRSAVLQIEAGMRLDEVEGLLGGDFFVSAISAKSEDTTTLTWYCNEGEIIIIFDSSNIVTAFMQAGFQRYPDARMKYDVLTNRQLLDNFQKVSLGITYPELEELMDNYIPLFKTKVNIDRSGTEETYEFARGHSEDAMSIHFVFRDGMLYEASALAIPKALLTTTDSSSALQIEEGMSYSEVVEILGEGYKARVDISYNGREHETYRWLILGEYSYFQVTFEDGFVYRKPYIP